MLKRFATSTSLLISMLVVGCDVLLEANNIPVVERYGGNVHRVVDGDSLYIEGIDTQFRLFGVDAPEHGEFGYAQAGAFLGQLVLNKAVQCDVVDIDKFDRFVSRCFLANGDEINAKMLTQKHTKEYCRFSKGFYGRC